MKYCFSLIALIILLFTYPQINAEMFFDDFTYAVTLKIDQNKDDLLSINKEQLIEFFKQLRSVKLSNKSINSITVLRKRIEHDITTIIEKSHSIGYWNAVAKYEIIKNPPYPINSQINQSSDKYPLINIKITLKLGHLYKIDDTYVLFKNSSKYFPNFLKQPSILEYRKLPASKDNLESLEDIIIRLMKNAGFPFAQIDTKKLVLNTNSLKAYFVTEVIANQKMKFGETNIQTNDEIDQQFIRNRLTWCPGENFSIDKIEQTKNTLLATQIFSKLDILLEEDKIHDTMLPLFVKFELEKPRLIEIELNYEVLNNNTSKHSTSISNNFKSIKAGAIYTHFNLFGHGEKLICSAHGCPMKMNQKHSDYEFLIKFIKPDTLKKSFTSDYIIQRKQNDTNAFFKKADEISAFLLVPFLNFYSFKFGIIFEESDITVSEIHYKEKTVCFPFSFFIDHTNSILNPTSGWRTALQIDPYFGRNGEKFFNITIGKLKFSYHKSFDELDKNVLSCWTRVSKIFVKNLNNVPHDKRIYAGGIGSIRGFGNQMAGHVNKNGVPYGSKSSIELGIEIKHKFTNNIGGVIFCEAARMPGDKIENTKSKFYTGIGCGLRYFTFFGPVRLDIATPINRRRRIDSKVQLYISLGQAF